jgi:hypothetical protein
MKKISKILFLVFLSFLFLFYSNTKNISENGSNIKNDIKKIKTENINSKLACNVSFGKIPLYFIQNKGQFNKKVLFYARTSKYFIWITKKGLIFDSVGKNKEDKTQHSTLIKRDVSRLLFKGANKSPEIVPIDTTNYKVNYFTGKDKSKWKTGINTSKAVTYKNIYPDIDLKVYGNEKQIEYDWIVRPGGNPYDIRFEFKDVKGTELDNKGNIVITTEFGKIIHKRPSAYQRKNNKIDVRFKKLSKNSYTFNIGKYNRTEKLIIDPLVLLYSTYLGGRRYDKGNGIAVDSSGCAYITGETESPDFPLQNHYMSYQGDRDAFVTKISADGQSLVFSTYLGGADYDWGYDIAVDINECAYVTGRTSSIDFPTQDPYMTDPGDDYRDAFVTKLSSDGQSLIYSTYLGGTFFEGGNSIAVDSNGCAYITGYTGSPDFPLKNPYMTNQCGHDAFVTKLSSDGQSLVYSTFLGGSDTDYGRGIAVDSSGAAYVTGLTFSSNFPTRDPYQGSSAGECDAFVTKLSADGQSLVYSTYLGGGDSDWGYDIAVDANECAYVTGDTWSTDFPLKNPYMSAIGDNPYTIYFYSDAFVTKLSADGRSLVFSTYLGGNSSEEGLAIAVDSNGCAYITGYASSEDFPLKNPYMTYPGNIYNPYHAFVTKFSADGQSLVFSTYLGGNSWDNGKAIAVDAKGYAYITGDTESSYFPLKNPYMSYKGGCEDAFVAVFKPIIILNISGARKTEKAWIINRDYAELNLLVDNISKVNVSKYVIYKKIDDGTYETLLEISGSSLIEGSYTYIDKFLDKDKTYTYKFIAYDSSNNIIATSNETSI